MDQDKIKQIQAVINGEEMLDSSLADEIIVNLIDNCDDEKASVNWGISCGGWCALVDKFESQFRYKIRNLR